MKKTGLLLSVAMLLFVSCQNQPESKSDILSKHPWSYHEIRFNDKITSAREMGNPIVAFKADKTYKLEYGPMADSGTWEIKSDTIFSTVSKVSNNQSQDLVILMLTSDTFRIRNIIESDILILTMVPYKGKEE